ncbi:hypothetical protein FE697_019210 [Mumia zhuanghuii]|uniref:Uncharacterized protein n=2 Tax=Mumia TaxID=1546255 RepID=A0ABW1QPF0_9ACTN|nr:MULTISPECIES: hypothetical protein [Mumia]KAA1420011.1 hypothetical protein FE697_019210 [Mumia zhuanghuii]
MEWFPSKPTIGQAVFGTLMLCALAAVPLYWSIDEPDRGNQVFLWVFGCLAGALAIVRAGVVVHLMLERRRR